MTNKKQGRYIRIQKQLEALLLNKDDFLSRISTINAVLYHKMDGFFWVGFYLLKGDKLLVGPYQGPLACLELVKNKGVCWEAINRKQPLVVPDVHKFPGHIACDARSKSEIVIPLKDPNNDIIGVLDIDSNKLDNFDETDLEQLLQITGMIFEN